MISIYTILPLFGFSAWSVILCIHVVAVIRAKFYLYRWQRKDDNASFLSPQIGVSIIKTMTAGSTNSNALRNLECLFELDYPKFEVLICLPDDKNKDLVTCIQDLLGRYSDIDAKLYTNACQMGVNPKINNMMQSYHEAKYDWVWVCDSSIFVNKWTLTELASHCDIDVGMVHQLPYMNTRPGFPSCLEKVYFGTHHARWYIVFDLLGQCCTNGMSSVLNKVALNQVGGLGEFSGYIAEDYFIGKSYFDRGFKIVLSSEPAIQNPEASYVTNFINRITRWQKLRITMLPTSALEPLIECLLCGFLGAFSVDYLFGISAMYIYVFHVGFWFSMDQVLMYIIEGNCSSLPPFWQRSLAWLYREVVTYWVFGKAIFNRKIKWRLGTFNINYGGKADFIEEPKFS